MGVSTRVTALAAVVVVVATGAAGVTVARDQGAFGCDYTDRAGTASLTLSDDAPRVRVRIGEGVRLAGRVEDLRDVVSTGDAGLAPGTQNGVPGFRGYVYRVTATGNSVITATTVDGRRVSGRVSAHC
jgi:hypothetical protein